MANEVLEGLQQFNQSIQSLAQQRALIQANDAVQQIQQSELNDQQKRQALQQYGQQFALQALATGINPAAALEIGKTIGPAQPLIQTRLQAALYGTPEQKQIAQQIDEQDTAQQIAIKQADNDLQLKMQKNQLDAAMALADKRGEQAEQIAQLKTDKKNFDIGTRVGKDFRNDKFLLAQGDLQSQANAIGDLLNRPDASGLDLYTAVDALHQLVERTASKEADIRRALSGSQSLLQNLQTQYNIKAGKLAVVPPEVKDRLLKTVETLASKYNTRADQRRQGYMRQLEGLGMDPTLFDPLAGVETFSSRQQSVSTPQPTAKPSLQFVPR